MVDIPETREIQVRWGDTTSLPMSYANQILTHLMPPAGSSAEPDGILLLFGNLAPPVIVGTPEQVDKQLAAMPDVEVQPLTRLVLSRARAEELLQILAQTLAQYDATAAEGSHARA